MNFFNKTKGAVSIFLVIILLPTLTFAGLFIDLGRTKLSQEVVTSAADLAINTVLSKYDTDLKDYYGLFASAKDNNDVVSLAKQYFKDCLISSGFTTSEADEYVDNLTGVFGDDELADMLRLSVENDVEIKPDKNSSMNNPAMVKEGIVEFMKYRAPINGVASLFEGICDSDVAEKVEDSSYEAKMTEAKKKFYEAEEDLIKQAEKAYEAIKKYRDYKTKSGKKISDESYLTDFSNFLSNPNGDGRSFGDAYKEAHRLMVKNLYNTHDDNEDLIELIERKSLYTYNSTTYSSKKLASAEKIKQLLIDYNTKLNDYVNKENVLQNKWNSIGAKPNGGYNIQYWVALTDKCLTAYNQYVNSANSLRKAEDKLDNAVKYEDDGAMDELIKVYEVSNQYVSYPPATNGEITYQDVYDTLTGCTYASNARNNGSSAYRNINSQISGINPSATKNELKTSQVGYIYNIRNKAKNYSDDFEEAAKLAKKAASETNKLKSLLKKYKDAFEEWDKKANVSELKSSKMADEDKEEIATLKEKGIDHFSEKSVEELVKRLNSIEEALNTFKNDIKDIKYNGTSVLDIYNFSKFKSAAKLDISKIVINEDQLNNYVDTSFKFSIGAQIQRILISDKSSGTFDNGYEYLITSKNHFNIENTSLELYEWMKYKFDGVRISQSLNESKHGFTVNDEDSAEDARGEIGDKSEEVDANNTKASLSGKSFSEWEGASLPSEDNKDIEGTNLSAKIEDVANFATEIFSNFGDTFSKSLVNMRDDLFMIDYTFNMFTYDAFENELKYGKLTDAQKKGITATKANGYYKNMNVSDYEEINSLTLNPRDTSNNWCYGGEVEYILYGNKSDAKNKTTAYSQIYMIRYAMDLAAVFDYYYDHATINAVALALEILAYIPQGVTKTLICLAITAAEAGMDLTYIRAGIPVTLLKSESDLICTYESLFSGGSNNTVVDKGGLKLNYSDYLKIFMYIKMLGRSENPLYLRTADVVQANVSQATNNFEFSMSESYVYYSLKADVIAEPMWSRLLAIDNIGDLSTSKGWRSISIETKRGY